MQITSTGGTWDAEKREPIYFIASSMMTLSHSWRCHKRVLVAINSLKSEKELEQIQFMIGEGVEILIDSGIFELATGHAKRHGMSMNDALGLAPTEVDGFDKLWEDYLRIVKRFGDKSWGYIELDQGGRENKIKTRKLLEDLGLRPIPVYHPINDGWDYFDYLAERYDRICMGNVVLARGDERRQLIAMVSERKRKYPHLWVHLLGVAPCEDMLAWPCDSSDASSWLNGVRWAHHHSSCMNKTCWPLPSGFTYRLGDHASWVKAWGFAAYQAHFEELTRRTVERERREVGVL